MFGYRLCPRCHGDLFADRDLNELSIVCLQCGYRTYLGGITNYEEVKSFLRSLYEMKNNYSLENEGEIPDWTTVTV